VGAALAVAPAAQAETLTLAQTRSGPQIFLSGHDPGWTLEVADFVNQDTGATVFGPIRRGHPGRALIRVQVRPDQLPHLWDYEHLGTAWAPLLVIFNHGRGQSGLGLGFGYISPWPAAPRLRHMFSIGAR
jgi:hypothetical protein